MDLRYWIWLAEALGPASSAVDALFSAFGCDAKRIWQADVSNFAALSSISARCKTALSEKSLARAEEILSVCNRLHIGILTPCSQGYPLRLKRLPNRPVVLYYFGKLPDLDDQACIATVGTRRMTPYGERMAYTVSYDLAKGGAVIVSGLAAGIDSVCHRAALDAGGYTIAVLGCGIDRVYPAFHRELMTEIARKGTLFSEYPPGTPPIGSNFPKRNRIITGLSLGTLVVEADLKSGAMISARYTLQQGKELFALPGKVGEKNSDGTLQLLARGAKLVRSGVDILEEYDTDFPHRIHIENLPAFQPKRTVSPIRKREIPQMITPEECRPEPPEELPFLRAAETSKPKKATKKQKAPTPPPAAVSAAPKPLPILSAAEQKIFACFAAQPLTADILAQKSGEPMSVILPALTLLEIKGCIRAMAGGAYISNFIDTQTK